MSSPKRFTDLLRQRGLVPEDVLSQLEEQARRAKGPVTPQWLADQLIQAGYLAPRMAERLLAELTPEPQELSLDEELSLLPLEEETSVPPPAPSKPGKQPPKPVSPTSPAVGAKVPSVPGERPRGPAAPPTAAPSAKGPAKPPAAAGPIMGDLLAEVLVEPVQPTEVLTPALGQRRRKSVWESNLILLGGGGLLLLVILLVVLLWAVRRQGAEGLLALADEDYRSGSYTQAVAKYTDFVERFPNHPSASLARVRRGLARLRQATEGTSDPAGALQTATEVLEEIASEPVFRDEARNELIALLPKIAQNLAVEAQRRLDSSLVQRAEEALALVNRYIMPADRPVTMLNDIQAILTLTTRRIASNAELEKTLKAIEEALARNDPAAAYDVRRDFIKAYPDLIGSEKLQQAAASILDVERRRIKPLEANFAVDTTDWPQPALASCTLACRWETTAAENLQGSFICAIVEGVLYGLDAATGRVLWRRMVGEHWAGRNNPFAPMMLGSGAQSDFLLVDTLHDELIRLEGATGTLQWRLKLGETPEADPVIAGRRIWVALTSGRLLEVDADSGKVLRGLQGLQPLRVGPAADPQSRWLFQPLEHSGLLVFRISDLECVQTVYLGHEPGALDIAPLFVQGHLLVLVNGAIDQASLYAFRLADTEEKPLSLVQELRFASRIPIPPSISGNRILFVTEKGSAFIYEVSTLDPDKPLKELAQGELGPAEGEATILTARSRTLAARFALLQSGQIWVADRQLRSYDVSPFQRTLQPKATKNERSISLQPLAVTGDLVVHVRAAMGLPGGLASAFRTTDAQLMWETRLGTPLAAEPIWSPQKDRLVVVSAAGAVYLLGPSELNGSRIIHDAYIALKPAELDAPLQSAIGFPAGQVLLVLPEGAGRISFYDPEERTPRFRWILLPDPLSGIPGVFRSQLLVGTRVGQVHWLDLRTGQNLAEPFQAPMIAGESLRWSQPMVISENEILIAENRGRIFRLGLADEPTPHLKSLGQTQWEKPLSGRLTVLGSVLWAIDEEGTAICFRLPELAQLATETLGDRVIWGPYAVGSLALGATRESWFGLDQSGKLSWRQPLPRGVPTGSPMLRDSSVIVAAKDGYLLRVDLATGRTLAELDLAVPLAGGPILLGEDLLVGGADGTLYRVRIP